MTQLTEEEKRSIIDWIALAKLEDGLIGIFVEGEFDRCLVKEFLKKCCTQLVPVYTAGEISFPWPTWGKHILVNNNKGRISAIAEILCQYTQNVPLPLFIIDADYDRHLDHSELSSCNQICRTDYTTMEMYSLSEETLEKFIALFLHGLPISAAQLLAAVTPAAKLIYYFNLFKRNNFNHVEKLDWIKSLELKENILTLNIESYASKFISRGVSDQLVSDCIDFVNNSTRDCKLDLKQSSTGHDLSLLLSIYVQTIRTGHAIKGLCTREIFERALICSVEIDSLTNFDLFKRIKFSCN